MSNRFYVNRKQIFGNNEMFPKTRAELEKQGAKWTPDGTFSDIEIKDPQSLMQAVEEDTYDYLKGVFRKDFEDISDEDLLLGYPKAVKNCIWDEKGNITYNTWLQLLWWIDDKRVFTSLNLYLAIRDDVDFDGKLTLKEGHKIIACMY